MIGGMAGQLPYWYAGMELAGVAAAATVPEMATATGVDLAAATAKLEQTRRLFNVAAGAAVQGSYNAAVAEDGHRMLEGVKGALEGGAFMVPFEFAGPLWKVVMGKHGVSEEAAKAVEAMAKGVADESEMAAAAKVVEADPSVVKTVNEVVGEAVKEGKKRGRPRKSPEVDPTKDVVQLQISTNEMKMKALQQQLDALVKPEEIPQAAETVAKALEQGASIEQLNGDPHKVLNFLQEVETHQNASGMNDLPVVMNGAEGGPVIMPVVEAAKPVAEVPEPAASIAEALPVNPLIDSLRQVLLNPRS